MTYGPTILSRAHVLQQKTASPVQFELTKRTRESIAAWIKKAHLSDTDYLFKSRVNPTKHLSTRQYNRIFHQWIKILGL